MAETVSARDDAPGKLASLSAVSGGLPEPEQTVEHHTGAANGPTPAITDSLTWTPGTTTPKRTETLTLSLTDVVVGATVSALLLAVVVQVHKRTGSLDPEDLRRRPTR